MLFAGFVRVFEGAVVMQGSNKLSDRNPAYDRTPQTQVGRNCFGSDRPSLLPRGADLPHGADLSSTLGM
jgi:hypothetical protein